MKQKDEYKWKKGLITKYDYRLIASICREGVRKAKSQNSMRLARNAKYNKRGFWWYLQNKKASRRLLLSCAGKVGKKSWEMRKRWNSLTL